MQNATVIGNQRQLFIDRRFIDRSTGIRLSMGRPCQHPEPVLVPDRPWETLGIGGYNTVLREPDGRFRMWYAAVMLTGLPQEGAIRLAYAESDDGLHWRKPDLDLVSFRGSRRNNIVAPLLERQSQQGATVYRDERAPPSERYKLLTKFRVTDREAAAGSRNGLYAMHSEDGLRWRLYPDQPCSPVMCDTQNICFWDDRIAAYVAYTRVRETQVVDEAAVAAGRRGFRSIGRMTSPDFRSWSAQTTVLQADEADLSVPLPYPSDPIRPPLDFYTSAAMKYAGAQDVYLMFPAVYYHWADKDFPATMDVQLLTSRDGCAWSRQGERRPFLRKGPEDSAFGGMIFANPWLVPVGNELWLYYAGTERRHASADKAVHSGVFRATLRRDGFVAAEAGYGGGELTTPPIVFAGRRLVLNFDGSAGGWCQVEIQDADGTPLPGYGLRDADPVVGNAVHVPVTWQGRADVGQMAGRPIRLRLVMRSALLYAFEFGPMS